MVKPYMARGLVIVIMAIDHLRDAVQTPDARADQCVAAQLPPVLQGGAQFPQMRDFPSKSGAKKGRFCRGIFHN